MLIPVQSGARNPSWPGRLQTSQSVPLHNAQFKATFGRKHSTYTEILLQFTPMVP